MCFGLAIGSITGGKIISIGRKKVVFITSLIGIIGVSLSMITNIWVILVGRLIYGYSTGIVSVLVPRYIEETVPFYLIGVCGVIFPAS